MKRRQLIALPGKVKLDLPAVNFRRRGQMNLACTRCHDRHAGDEFLANSGTGS